MGGKNPIGLFKTIIASFLACYIFIIPAGVLALSAYGEGSYGDCNYQADCSSIPPAPPPSSGSGTSSGSSTSGSSASNSDSSSSGTSSSSGGNASSGGSSADSGSSSDGNKTNNTSGAIPISSTNNNFDSNSKYKSGLSKYSIWWYILGGIILLSVAGFMFFALRRPHKDQEVPPPTTIAPSR